MTIKQKSLILIWFLIITLRSIAQPYTINQTQRDSIFLDSLITVIITDMSGATIIDDPIAMPLFLQSKYFQRGDTIFKYYIYLSNNQIDSVKCCDTLTIRLSRTKWAQSIMYDSYFKLSYSLAKTISIIQFKKIKHSKWFLTYNDKYFHAENECNVRKYESFNSDGSRYVALKRFGKYCIWQISAEKIKKGKAILFTIPRKCGIDKDSL